MDPRDHIGQEELDQIGTLNVKDRVQQLKLNHVFKIWNNTAPAYMYHHFLKILCSLKIIILSPFNITLVVCNIYCSPNPVLQLPYN